MGDDPDYSRWPRLTRRGPGTSWKRWTAVSTVWPAWECPCLLPGSTRSRH